MIILREKTFTSKTTKALRKAIASREGKDMRAFRREISRKVNSLDASGKADMVGNINRLINKQSSNVKAKKEILNGNPVDALRTLREGLHDNGEIVIPEAKNGWFRKQERVRPRLGHNKYGDDIFSSDYYDREDQYKKLLDRQYNSGKKYQSYLEKKNRNVATNAKPAKSKKQLDKEELDRQIKKLGKSQSVLLFSEKVPEDQKEFSKTSQLKSAVKKGFIDSSGKKLGSARLQQMWQEAATGTRDQLYRMVPDVNSSKNEIAKSLNRSIQLNVNGATDSRLKDLADLHNVIYPGKKRITPGELHKQLSKEALDIRGEKSIEKAKERLRKKLGITLPKNSK